MFEKNSIAVANACKLIEKYCIKLPNQYSLEELLNAEGLVYIEESLDGLAGNIVFTAENGIVTVNSNIESETQKIFTAAHELGHFENEAHTRPLPKGEEKALIQPNFPLNAKGGYSKARGIFECGFEDVLGVKRTSRTETAANDFAAELLMHKPWFEEFTKSKKLSLTLLSECAEHFTVSLSAAAFRYAEIGNAPCAIIMSTDGVVKWSSINKSFPYQFLRNGLKVHNMSYAFDLHKAMHNYKLNLCSFDQMKRNFAEVPKEEDIPAFAWFNEDYSLNGNQNIRIMEANIAMHNYNSVITVLWEV